MKHFYFFTFTLLLSASVNAQTVFSSNFSSWTSNSPDGWVGSKTNFAADSIIEVSTGAMYGTASAQLINTSSSHKRFTTQPVAVTNGQNYEIRFWVKGKGDVRTGIFDNKQGTGNFGYHYGSYISVNDVNWKMYSQVISADTTFNSAEFILSIKTTDAASGHLIFDSVAVVIPSAQATSIYDIQYTTDTSGNSSYMNQQVTTGGIVTARYSSGYFLQAGTGAWSGIHVFDSVGINIGDSVIISGKVVEYFKMTQITNVSSFTIVSGNQTVPAASVISTNMANSEPYEGVLVKVINATCTNPSAGFGEWTVDDNSGPINVDDMLYPYSPVLNTKYNVTGVINYSFSSYKILPRNAADIQVSTSANNLANNDMVSVFPNPASEKIFISLNPNQVVSVKISDVSGKIIFEENRQTNFSSIDVSSFSEGIYFISLTGNDVFHTSKIVVRH
jgi:hypothetical protein